MMDTNEKVSPLKTKQFEFGPWTLTTQQSHILQSRCQQPGVCSTTTQDFSKLCRFCLYDRKLSLPQLPDMVFADNLLTVSHQSGCSLQFNSLDALSLVDCKHDLMKVAVAEAWKEARKTSFDNDEVKGILKPFDWTFTTDYNGSLTGNWKVSKTDERIDVEKLKQKEKILFYDDVHLFEDELADNGSAELSVKVRVMPSSVFILQRFYLRVDNVLVRVNDTRIYHELGSNYLLREYSRREEKFTQLKLPTKVLNNSAEIWVHLPIVEEKTDKLELPE